MECMAQEPVLFEDILCQIIDMIGPEVCSVFLQNYIVHGIYVLQWMRRMLKNNANVLSSIFSFDYMLLV